MKHYLLSLEKNIAIVSKLTTQEKILYLESRNFNRNMLTKSANEESLTNTVLHEYAIDDLYNRSHNKKET